MLSFRHKPYANSGVIYYLTIIMNSTNRNVPVKKVSLSLQGAVEACRVQRHLGSHIVYTVGSQMAMRLPALSAGLPLLPRRFLVQ
jgi:hypothetical protein